MPRRSRVSQPQSQPGGWQTGAKASAQPSLPKGQSSALLWLLTWVAIASLPAQAQVVPDNTLGNGNNSVTNTINNRTDITGGLRRSSSLFHSFERFNVITNHQVYFANPTGIQNIFSRVTGGSLSSIDGTLGVAGAANLFFINPNGIIFGPNARLDVSGSFFATTADALVFPDSQRFAARGDRAVPLVEVNIPIGLQYGANPPAMLTNRGTLATGQDLTLAAGNLDLQGQIQAGRDLTLQATDTVRIRDTVAEPFRARSGRDTVIQGNQSVDILALNHLTTTPFVSGGNLSLISDGIISGDTHFSSGGMFEIRSISGQPANFTSLYDPIISSVGDVEIAGGYGLEGGAASLLIESQGNVRILGNVIIENNDATSPFVGSDAVLATSPGLIIRSGQTNLVYGGGTPLSGPPPFTNGPVPAGITGITITGGINVTNNGIVSLDAGANGPIDIGEANGFSIFAGSISIDTNNSLTASGILSVRRDGSQRSGDITIGNNRQPSSVTVGAISTRNLDNANNGGGGNITVRTTGAFSTTGAFNSTTGQPAPLNIQDPNIVSIASEASAGQSGNISIISTGGPINLANRRISSASNFNGNGGDIQLTATSINTSGGVITSRNDGTTIGSGTDTNNVAFTPNPGVGGNVSLTATSGNINSGSIIASSRNDSSSNLYSIINLIADTGSVFLDQANLSSSNSGSYWAGDVRITANNSIQATNSRLESNGYFGIVNLRTTSNNSTGINVTNSTISAAIPEITTISTTVHPSSRIDIGSTQVTITNSEISTTAEGFRATPQDPFQDREANGGNISIQGNSISIVQNSQVETTTGFNVRGNSGNITIGALPLPGGLFSTTTVSLENSSLSTSANGQGNSGDIRVTANQSIRTTGGSIRATTASSNTDGIAGDVVITSQGSASQAIQLNDTSIDVAAFALSSDTSLGGQTGSVTINAPNRGDITLVGTANIFTDTFGSRPTGDLTISGGNILIDGYNLNATVNSQGGDGGNILIDGDSVTIQNNSDITTATNGPGKSGNITVQSTGIGDLLFANGILSTTVNNPATGSGGDITIQSNGGQITFDNAFEVNSATNTQNPLAASGTGGNVLIDSSGGLITVDGNSTIDASTSGVQTGGTVIISSGNQNIQFNSGSIRTTVEETATANGGSITIESNGGNISVGSANSNFEINAATAASNTQSTSESNGIGGDITILSNGGQVSVVNNSTINAATTGTKDGGTVNIQAGENSIELENSRILASSENAGTRAREITLAGQSINLQNSSVLASSDQGTAGNIFLNTQQLRLQENSQVSAATAGSGDAGNLTVNDNGSTADAIFLLGGSRLTLASTGNGNAGNVLLNTRLLTIEENSEISTITVSGAIGGDVTLQGISTFQMDNGQIKTETGTGRAGDLTVNSGSTAAETITLNNSSLSLAATDPNGAGTAGNIFLNTQQLTLENNSFISASTAGSGQAGNLIVSANGGSVNSINLLSGSNLTLASTGSGNAGNVLLDAQQLNIDNSLISASTVSGTGGGITLQGVNTLQLNSGQIAAETGTGQAGNLTVNSSGTAAETITLNNSALSLSATDPNGDGTAGNVFLNTQQLTLENNSSIPASTAGSGQAGSLTVNANGGTTRSIDLLDNSNLTLASTGSGNAGNVLLDTQQLNVNNSLISASTVSGTGGGITLQGLNTLQMNNGQISAATQSGQAGNVSVNAANTVTLDNGSVLSVEANAGGTAGNLTVNAGNRLTLNNSQATVSSPTGQAGNLTVRTNDLRMNRGTLEAVAGAGEGANINIQVLQGLLLMRFNSLISADARNQANGGNITINAPFIIGLTFENSDIAADAVQGRGGNINITTNGIFGLQFRPRRTPLSDITASSQFGVSGNVVLRTLNIDATRGLSPPPLIFNDVSQVVGGVCEAVGAKATENSELRITGRGGVALSPTVPLPAQSPGSDWVSLEVIPQAPMEVTLRNGSTVTLEPGQTYQLQATCVKGWKEQVRSPL